MKILKWIGWSSAAVGTILMALGVLSQLTVIGLFPVQHNVSYMHAANSFFLLAIVLFIATKNCCTDCCSKDDK